MSKENLHDFVTNFKLPISEKELDDPSYIKFSKGSAEENICLNPEKAGGKLPTRKVNLEPQYFDEGKILKILTVNQREMSTTMVFVRLRQVCFVIKR